MLSYGHTMVKRDVFIAILLKKNNMDIIPLEVSYKDQIKIYVLQSIVYVAKALYTSKVMVI